MNHQNIKELIRSILVRQGSLSNRDVVAATGLTPQAIHYHLKAMLASGELIPQGRGRGTRYRLAEALEWRYEHALSGLSEEEVWREVEAAIRKRTNQAGEGLAIFNYALTELVNNAIDHSGGQQVIVSLRTSQAGLWLQVCDDGVGVFEHIRRSFDLEGTMTALQELTKGKLTTQPNRHTGEGIFFVSKVADRFELESDGLRWLVDNGLQDMAVEQVDPPLAGTRALFLASLPPVRSLEEVFARYTRDYKFSKSRLVVKLFDAGERFMSRSEARRLLHGLERFGEVVLDFKGVVGVGQGFVDEVFRVWARSHPETELIPENMAPAVEFMVTRGLPRGDSRR